MDDEQSAAKRPSPGSTKGPEEQGELRARLDFALAIIEAAPSLTYVYDLSKRRNIYISEQSLRMLGYTPAEIAAMGANVQEILIHPEDMPRVKERFAHIRECTSDDIHEIEYRMQRKEGGYVWLLSRDRVFKRDASGQPLQILGVATDITERKNSEESLIHSKTSLELALDGGEAAPWQYNVQTRQTEWSPIGYELLGFAPGAVSPSLDLYAALVHPKDREALAEVRRRESVAPPGTKFKLRLRMTRNDGAKRWIERRSMVGPHEAGGQRIFGIDLDVTGPMAAEERLVTQQELLNTVLRSTPDLVWAKDKDGFVTLANKATVDALGEGEAVRILGCHASDIFPDPEVARGMDEDERRIMASGLPETVEEEFTNRGRHLILQTVKAPLRDRSGAVQGIVGVSRDVTAQRDAERRLAEQKALLEAIGSSSPDLIFAKDRNLRMIYANPATLDYLGKTASEVIGRSSEDLTPNKSDGDDHSSNDRQVMETGETAVFDEQVTFPDGRQVFYRSRKSPLRDATGQIIGTMGVAVDMTETRATELALRESEERLAAALHAGQLGVFDYDPKTGVTKWDKRLRDIWGVGEDEPVSNEIFQGGIHPDDWPGVEAAIARAANPKGDGRYHAEYRVLNRAHGGTRWVQAEGNMFFVNGTASRFVGTVQDISERKRAELQIRMLMREVNHRSKNMLAVVQAIANQTSIKDEPRAFARRFTERLQGLAASHDLLVNNAWQGVDLAELVSSQLAHFRDLVRNRIIFDGPPIRITPAAAQALGMALHELATNAGKYGALSGDRGTVTIGWEIKPEGGENIFRMTWVESGGPPVIAPAQRGFGTRLLSEMTQLTLQGKVQIEYAVEGFRWTAETVAEKILEVPRTLDNVL
jgi:PAS domain S-box-containing protein